MVRNRADHEVVLPAVELCDRKPVFAVHLGRVGERVGGLNPVAEPAQPPDQVDGAAVAKVRYVFLERETEHESGPCLRGAAVVERVGDPLPHAVVDSAAC